MNSSLRPVGIALSLVGNLFMAFGLGGFIAWANQLADTGLHPWQAAVLAAARPAAMAAFGYLLIRQAPRFGGGSFGVQFVLIGILQTLSAVHATDSTERFVSGFIGGLVLLISVIGLIGIAMAYGWKHALTHASPSITVGGVTKPMNAMNFANALKAVSAMQSLSAEDPAALGQAKLFAPQADALTSVQRAQAVSQIDKLVEAGTITAEQAAAMKQWMGPV